MNTVSDTMTRVMLSVSEQESFGDLTIVMAYDSDIKPTPVKEPIVAFSLKGAAVGPQLTTTKDNGEVVLTTSREIAVTMNVDIYLPYSKGAVHAYGIYDRLATFLIYESGFSVEKSTCYDAEYDKSCQAIILKTVFVFNSTASM